MPATSATIIGSVVDLDFSVPGDLYVLQMTYSEGSVPGSILEDDLRVLFFDTGLISWAEAIDGNSDTGAGALLFAGSFTDFEATLGGGPLPLSTFGIDTTNNHAWAILDHATDFGLGILGTAPGDLDGSGTIDEIDIDIMRNAILSMTSDPAFNVDGIGSEIPNEADFDFLIENIIGTGRGDGDLNKIINFSDFVLLANSLGGSGTNWIQGNYNVDTLTNFNDFVELSTRFGMTFPSDGQVPEPASLVLMLTGAVALTWGRFSTCQRRS